MIMVLNNSCAMKKIVSIFAFAAVAAATLVSCSKEIDNPEVFDNGVKMKTITVKTAIETKTTLDAAHENIVWSAGDKISIFNDANNANLEAAYAEGADITIEVPETTTEIYAHYPYYSGNTNGPESVSVYIANNQTQTNPGQLNGYFFPMVAKGTVSADNKALISLYPVAGALALNLYNTGLSGEESVKSVKVTPASANTNFTGRQTTDLTGDNIVYSQASISDPVTVTLTNALALGSTKPTDKQTFAGQIYVCLAKQSYSEVTFEIETDKGTYTITSNNTAFDLENNDFVPVNINLAKASFKEPETAVDPTAFSWILVKDVLAIGDKVVIAADESNVAMSTDQRSNNRGQIAVTKSGNALTANADVQVFEVVSGSASSSFAFKCLNGDQIGKYIAAASSGSNNMHSNSSIDANASWSVEINTSTGVAGVVAQGSYTRNTLKYNSSSSLFSCYAESNSMADIVFYRAGLPAPELSFPEDSYSVNIGETFTAPALTNPSNVAVTYSSSDEDVAVVDENTGEVLIGDAGTTTITASFAGSSSYSANSASYELTVVDPNVERWVKTAIGSITTSDVFVIVGDGYAVTNDNGTSAAPTAQSVSIANDALSDTPAANLQWKLTGNASAGYSFSPASDASIYLYCNTTAQSSSNNNIRVGTGVRKVWEFQSNGIMQTKDTYTVRYFSKYNNQDWRGYTGTSNGAIALEFYVKQGGSNTPSKTLSSITVTAPTKTAYTVGDTFDATGMVVTATYSDETTADVTTLATTDFATQVASAGNKTVTVSYTEDGITETGTFNITVSAAAGSTSVTFVAGTDTSSSTELSKGDVTITTTSGTFSRTDNYRIYANNSMIVSVPSGKNIKSIAFTISQNTFTTTTGTYNTTSQTWTGSANSITLSASGGQVRITQIVVTYE